MPIDLPSLPPLIQPQQLLSVVIPIRRPHQRMNVERQRQRIIQKHARVVVELDHHHRRMHLVVETVFARQVADPRQVRLGPVRLDLAHLGAQRASGEVVQAQGQEGADQGLLRGRRGLLTRDAFVGDHAVVLECTAEMALVGAVVPPLGVLVALKFFENAHAGQGGFV